MSYQPTENAAHEAANELLMDALCAVNLIAEERRDKPADPLLAAAHMVVAKLDSMETSLLNVLRDLHESVDFLLADTVGDEAGEVATEHEREVMYRALEANYMAHNIPTNIKERDDVLARFKKIAGL